MAKRILDTHIRKKLEYAKEVLTSEDADDVACDKCWNVLNGFESVIPEDSGNIFELHKVMNDLLVKESGLLIHKAAKATGKQSTVDIDYIVRNAINKYRKDKD